MAEDQLRYFLSDDRFSAARWGKHGKVHIINVAETLTMCGMWNREKLIDLEPDGQGSLVFDELELCGNCQDVLDNSGISVSLFTVPIIEASEIPELIDAIVDLHDDLIILARMRGQE